MCLLQSCYLRAGGVCDAKSYPYLEGRNLGQSFLDGTVTRLNLQERKRGSGAVGKRSLNKKNGGECPPASGRRASVGTDRPRHGASNGAPCHSQVLGVRCAS